MVSTKELVDMARSATLVFIGPTAAGKDTLLREVSRAAGVAPLVSHTTRPMREGEIHGIEYWFVDEETFESLPMIAHRTYHVAINNNIWHYGLSEKEGFQHGALVLDWEGYLNFAKWREERGMSRPVSVYVPVEIETARRRQKQRGDYNKAEFERRWYSDSSWTSAAAVQSDYVWQEK